MIAARCQRPALFVDYRIDVIDKGLETILVTVRYPLVEIIRNRVTMKKCDA